MSLKLIGVALLTVGVLLITAGVATADGGPHGQYQDTTNGLTSACAACHRVHQGLTPTYMLKAESQYALCVSCHNGNGSILDVMDGMKLSATLPMTSSVKVRKTDVASSLDMSVAPYGELSALAGNGVYFTIRLYNDGNSDQTVNLDVTGGDSVITGTGHFNPSDFVTFTGNDVATDPNANHDYNPGNPITTTGSFVTSTLVPAGQTAYARLRTRPAANANPGDDELTTVTINGTDLIMVETRVDSNVSNILNGGGFNFVGAKPTTSRHNANPADQSLNPWGFAGEDETQNFSAGGRNDLPANTGENPNQLSDPLQCTSCHNPHGGTGNYRMLLKHPFSKDDPSLITYTVSVQAFYTDTLSATGVYTTDEGGPGNAFAAKYTKDYYGSYGDNSKGIASFCGGCHTAYPSDSSDDGVSSASNPTMHYRHRTEMPYTIWTNPTTGTGIPRNPETNPLPGFPALRLASGDQVAVDGVPQPVQHNTVVTCLTCHRVHGTDATMSGWALKKSLGGLGDEDITPSQIQQSQSTLLFANNRGFCEACHQW